MVSVSAGAAARGRRGHVITPVSITGGYQQAGTGPQVWVIAAAGLAIGLGSYSGGWRIMRTMGKGIIDIQSPQSFAAETTSAAAILASSHLGLGLSTTQVCSGSIVGSGIGRGWPTSGAARKMVYAWLLTLPAAAVFGAIAAAIALTGTLGLILVFVALLAGGGAIWAISRRAPVSADNVNDSPDVVITREKASGPA